MKHFAVTVLALLVAATSAVGISVMDSESATAAAGNAKRCGGGKFQLTSAEYTVFKQHNSYRARKGAAPLCISPKLQQAARQYASSMLRSGKFEHGNVEARLARVGYKWRTYGENIGYGYAPPRMVKAWINSSGHEANMRNKAFKQVGVGVRYGKYRGTPNIPMYVVDFGTPR